MRQAKNFVVLTLLGTVVGTALAVPDIESLLKDGQLVAVYEDGSKGQCVGAFGFAPQDMKANKAIVFAKTGAIEEITAFVKGRQVSSQSQSQMQSVNGKLSESFSNKIQTNTHGLMKSVEVVKTGNYDGQRYVFAQVCEKQSKVSKKLASRLNDNTLTVVGIASTDQGREKARRMAIDDALRNAVTQYHGVDTMSQTTLSDGSELQSKTATRSNGMVSKYQIVNEDVKDDIYRVQIVATVVDKPKDSNPDALTIRENLGRPSIYIETTDSLARKELEVMLRKHKFDITRRKDQARFILTAKVERIEQPAIADMMGCRTVLDISLKDKMSSDQALVITNDPDQSIEASDNATFRKSRSMNYAVHSIRNELLGGLNNEFNNQFHNGTKVVVTFSNFARMSEVEAMANLLNSFPLTKKVVTQPVRNNVAYFDVLYLGDPNELQLQAMKNAYKFKLNGLRAKNQKGDGIDFTF